MACIVGINIPCDKRIIVSFTYIYGTGSTIAKKVLVNVGVSEDVRVRDLANKQIDAIRTEIDKLKAKGDLRREVNLNIKRLMKISSYCGIRRRRGLPAHGQGTKNSVRTRKGPTKTVVGKKK